MRISIAVGRFGILAATTPGLAAAPPATPDSTIAPSSDGRALDLDDMIHSR